MAKRRPAKLEKIAIPNKRVLVNRQVINPVTGQEVWVDIVAVNATSSKKALDDLKRSFASAIDVSRYQGDLQGRAQGMSEAQKGCRCAGQNDRSRRRRSNTTGLQAPPKAPSVSNPAAKTGGSWMAATSGNKNRGTATGGGYSDD